MNYKIMSIDLGSVCGISFYNDGFIYKEEYKVKHYSDFFTKLKELFDLYKPNLVLIPYPTRFYRVILAHAKLMGIVELLCSQRDVQCIEVQDATCKKLVLGTGKAKKEDIMNYFNEYNEHISDSMMFTEFYLKSIDTKEL